MTALSNDYGYEEVFARQVRAHGRAGDVADPALHQRPEPQPAGAPWSAANAEHHHVGADRRRAKPLAGACDEAVMIDALNANAQEGHLIALHAVCRAFDLEVGRRSSGVLPAAEAGHEDRGGGRRAPGRGPHRRGHPARARTRLFRWWTSSDIRRRAGGAGLVARCWRGTAGRVTLVDGVRRRRRGRQPEATSPACRRGARISGHPTPVKTRSGSVPIPWSGSTRGAGRLPVPRCRLRMLRAVGKSVPSSWPTTAGESAAKPGAARACLQATPRKCPSSGTRIRPAPEPVPGVAVVTPNLAEATKAAAAVTQAPPQVTVRPATRQPSSDDPA